MPSPARAFAIKVWIVLTTSATLSCAPVKRAVRRVLPAAAPSATAPATVTTASLGSLRLTRWRLGNGLQVVIAPDPTATSVSLAIWYRVGARHEKTGETGLAHLFEHLMFTQTKGAEVGAFDRALEEVGASTNAMTDHDYTAYLDDLPPDALPLAVRLEADRMVNLALRGEQVETEREVVLEERLASVEDDVDGLLGETLYAQAFRHHPYGRPVIGLHKDIKAVTRKQVQRFYEAHYAPNNAVVVVTGRLEEKATLELVAQHFGPLAAVDLPQDEAPAERAPASVVRSEVRQPVPADRLVVGFRAPALGHADRPAFDLLHELLAEGASSRLQRRLVVEAAIASSVRGELPVTRDDALYSLWVQLRRGHDASAAEAALDEELVRLTGTPVPAPELARAKARLETAFWAQLESSSGRAEQIGTFEVVAGGFERLLARAEEYERVSAEDVQRVARAYLADGGRSVVVARPGS